MTLAHAQSETGTITGHIRLTTKVRAPLPANAYPSRSIGKHDAPATPEIHNVVVYLKDAPFRGTLRRRASNCTSRTRRSCRTCSRSRRDRRSSFPTTTRSSITCSRCRPRRRSISGATRADRRRPWKFTKPGLVKVFCDIHSHMSASILVLDHPYFAIPAPTASSSSRNVPPGQYTLVGWHERVGERAATRARDSRAGDGDRPHGAGRGRAVTATAAAAARQDARRHLRDRRAAARRRLRRRHRHAFAIKCGSRSPPTSNRASGSSRGRKPAPARAADAGGDARRKPDAQSRNRHLRGRDARRPRSRGARSG